MTMFADHVVTPEAFAVRFVELLPEYLPGVDTGAFEPTDRRRCWNKSVNAVLTVMGNELGGLQVVGRNLIPAFLKDQSSLMWQREGAPVFAMTTGWGNRNELEESLEWLEAFKCPQKLFIYSCTRWQDAVLDQIGAALFRYPYHLDGEQYFFMNLVGAENRLQLMATNVSRGGRAASMRDLMPRPVPGSPFSWSGKPLRTSGVDKG
jgi:hypothetical protein